MEQKISQNFKGNRILEILCGGDFQLKLIDFSNACWVDHSFSESITTRPNRSPEVLLGMSYNEKTDIWSCGCLFYKLIAKDNLFIPQEFEEIDKDEDHLAQIFEVVHEIDSSFLNSSPKKKVIQT